MKKHSGKILIGVILIAILSIAFYLGGNTTPAPKEPAPSPPKITENATPTTVSPKADAPKVAESTSEPAKEAPTPKEKPSVLQQEMHKELVAKTEPKTTKEEDTELTCTLSIRCDTLLKNINRLDPNKVELVPKDGAIYAEQKVTFYEGESVYNILLRETKKNKIHFEFTNTPIYNSAYVEGIANLYEFDCGELSGWSYRVNGVFPNYGCSRYFVKDGDKIEWLYTCDLGKDIGGYNDLSGE